MIDAIKQLQLRLLAIKLDKQLVNHCKRVMLQLPPEPEKCTGSETSVAHLRWMLRQVPVHAQKDVEKAHRWVGFVQGVMVGQGATTVKEMRAAVSDTHAYAHRGKRR